MFELSKDHEDFRRLVRDFAEDKIAPHVEQWDRDHHFPSELVPQMGELGLFGLVVGEEYGGAGLEEGGFTYLCLAIEELGRVDQSMGITLSAGVGLGINPILTYGNEEQKQQWLPDLVAGRHLAGFAGSTIPLSLLTLGAFILALSAGWHPLRAALLRGQTTLLPPARAPGVVADDSPPDERAAWATSSGCSSRLTMRIWPSLALGS